MRVSGLNYGKSIVERGGSDLNGKIPFVGIERNQTVPTVADGVAPSTPELKFGALLTLAGVF
jgi:hypothetical protein